MLILGLACNTIDQCNASHFSWKEGGLVCGLRHKVVILCYIITNAMWLRCLPIAGTHKNVAAHESPTKNEANKNVNAFVLGGIMMWIKAPKNNEWNYYYYYYYWINSCHSCYDFLLLINCMVQTVYRQIPVLVRTMGSSSDLLEIISDPPSGSKNLLMQVLLINCITCPSLCRR